MAKGYAGKGKKTKGGMKGSSMPKSKGSKKK
jgi:hypothetical protein